MNFRHLAKGLWVLAGYSPRRTQGTFLLENRWLQFLNPARDSGVAATCG